MAMLIQRMDEQLATKSLTEDLSAQVESTEKGQDQVVAALRRKTKEAE